MADQTAARGGGMESKIFGIIGKQVESQLNKKFGGVRDACDFCAESLCTVLRQCRFCASRIL
jgi:hypothetical protein